MTSPFEVVYFKSVKEKTQESFRRLRKKGLGEPFIEAAATIDRELRRNPREFGDPCFSYPHLQLDVFVRAVQPLVVYYGVHQTEAVVFVTYLDVME